MNWTDFKKSLMSAIGGLLIGILISFLTRQILLDVGHIHMATVYVICLPILASFLTGAYVNVIAMRKEDKKEIMDKIDTLDEKIEQKVDIEVFKEHKDSLEEINTNILTTLSNIQTTQGQILEKLLK